MHHHISLNKAKAHPSHTLLSQSELWVQTKLLIVRLAAESDLGQEGSARNSFHIDIERKSSPLCSQSHQQMSTARLKTPLGSVSLTDLWKLDKALDIWFYNNVFYYASIKLRLVTYGRHGTPSHRKYYFTVISVLTVFIPSNSKHMSNGSVSLLEKMSHIYALTTLLILLLQNEVTWSFVHSGMVFQKLRLQTLHCCTFKLMVTVARKTLSALAIGQMHAFCQKNS